MFFTHRRFGTATLTAGVLILIGALGVAITNEPPPGSSAPISKPRAAPPNAVALNPGLGGTTDPSPHLTIPGRSAVAQYVRPTQARVLDETAGGVRVRGPQPTFPVRAGDVLTPERPQATFPDDTHNGGTVSAPQPEQPGDTANGGTSVGTQVSVLGVPIGVQVTLR